MRKLFLLLFLFYCSIANADFNTGDTFGKGMVIQANGTTQTGGGRTLNFASGTTVTVVNNAYQITASGSGGVSSVNAQDDGVGIGTFTTLNLGANISGSITNNVLTANGSAGGSSQWITTANIGIGTTDNVGIGTIIASGAKLVVLNGNVGIGSVSPTSALCVGTTCQGKISSTGAATTVGITNTGAAITNDNSYTQSGTSANNFTGTSTFSNATNSAFFTGGKVGIGTISPGSSLSILNNLSVGSYATNAGPVGGAIFSGNIGIGQTTAGDQLDITGTNISAGMTVTSTASTGYAYHEMVGSGGNLIDVDAYGATKSGTTLNQSNNNLLTIFSSGGTLAIGPLDAQPIVMGNNNNEYFRIAAAGNVGIQTANPGAGLDINGSERIRSTNSLYFGNDNNASILASANTTQDLKFLTNNTEYMRITNGGNVGIGTVGPVQKLEVNGTAKVTGLNIGTIGYPTSSTADNVLQSDGTNVVQKALTSCSAASSAVTYNTSTHTWGCNSISGSGTNYWTLEAGNVGINTTTVNVGIGTVTTSALLTVVQTGSGDAFRVDDVITDTTPFLIKADGNVGIGTTNPLATFNIASTDAQALLRVDDNGAGDLSPFIIDQNGNVGIGTANTETDKLLVMGGNVGIGTWIPSTTLDVKGSVVVQSGNVGVGTTIVTTSALTVMNGNVGIGTWIPATLLHVIGTGTFGTANALISSFPNAVGIGTTSQTSGTIFVVNGGVGIGTANSTYVNTTIAPSGGMIMSGNLGVGTYIPAAQLAVGNTSQFTVNTSGAITAVTGITTSGAYTQSGSGVNSFTGNVGAGTTLPIKNLQVGGDVFLDRTTSTIWMREPDGTCGSCTLSNGEVFTCVSATCP